MGTTLFGVFVLSLVLVVGNIFKEVLPRLVDQSVSLGYLLEFIVLVLPFSLVFTIPWGFLTAVLLVFGRLSADSELVSMRMAGISTFRISLPVLLLALVFSGFCLWINSYIAPQAKTAMERIVFDMAYKNPEALLKPDIVSDFDNRVIFFRKGDSHDMQDLTIFQTDGQSRLTQTVHAARGSMSFDEKNLLLQFGLHDASIAAAEAAKPEGEAAATEKEGARDKPREREAGKEAGLTMSHVGVEEMITDPRPLSSKQNRRVKAAALTNAQILEALSQPPPAQPEANDKEATSAYREALELRNTFRSELSKRFSFSLACLTFCLVGIPLGITAHRRETAVGFVLSLIVASLYFFFIIIGDTLSGRSGPLPHLFIWAPNVLFLGLGAWMFRRLNKR